MAYNIGPKIGIDGEKEFRSQIKNINDTYKALEAQTKAVTRVFEANGDTQGKLEATSKQLQKQIDLQKQKMTVLEDAVKKATEKYGENSIEATRLQGALYDTQATVAELESKLRENNRQLEENAQAMEQTAESTEEAAGATEDFSDSTEKAAGSTFDFGDALRANIIADVIVDGLRQMADATAEFAKGSIQAAADVKAANAQFEQTFGQLEDTARTSLQAVSDDTKIAATRMQSSYTMIYAFAKNAGASSAEALNIASRAMIAATDSAAYYDKSIEEVTETLQAFLKGNYANDAALGISATETTRNTKANELYGKSFIKLSESQKVDVLLAMVEAGNKASGAIGQAARESDSWENVTGELAEVFRLLQAEVGKPALQKLVPIIQKLTAWGYELIEDIDWDGFADTVENLIDGAIEDGPTVIKLIASVAAGLAAMKIGSVISNLTGMAASFLGVGTAATAAGGAVAASGTVAAASPWGAAAFAIGAAATLVVSFCTRAYSEAEKLEKSMDEFEESMERAEEAYKEACNDAFAAATAAEYYVDRLEKLEKAGLDTAVAQRDYAMTVEALNDQMPELNLQIDEQTGLLTQNTSEIRENIQALKDQAIARALQDRYEAEVKAWADANAELAETQVKLQRLQEQEADLLEELGDDYKELHPAVDAVAEAIYHTAVAYTGSYDAMVDHRSEQEQLAEGTEDLAQKQESLNLQLQLNRYEQKELTAAIEYGENQIKEYEETISLAKEAAANFGGTSEEVSAAQIELNLRVEDVQGAVDALSKSYEEAKISARDSIDTQIGLFDELVLSSDLSAEKIISNWASQREAFDNYAANLKKAVDMGLDEDLVRQLSDGSTESMVILNEFVNSTEVSIDEINAAFRGLEESKDTVAAVWADIQTDFSENMEALETDAENSGIEIVNGIARGIQSQTPYLEETIKNTAKKIPVAFDTAMGIHSPARVMIPRGAFTVEGAALGVDQNAASFEKAMEKLAVVGMDAFDRKRLEEISIVPPYYAQQLASRTETVSHNYGGQTFQIYQQPGESPRELAERIMEIMHTRVESKEVAFRG